jgi:hypothetical protein
MVLQLVQVPARHDGGKTRRAPLVHEVVVHGMTISAGLERCPCNGTYVLPF